MRRLVENVTAQKISASRQGCNHSTTEGAFPRNAVNHSYIHVFHRASHPYGMQMRTFCTLHFEQYPTFPNFRHSCLYICPDLPNLPSNLTITSLFALPARVIALPPRIFVEKANRAAVKLKRAGLKINRAAVNVKRAGLNVKRAAVNVNRAGLDVNTGYSGFFQRGSHGKTEKTDCNVALRPLRHRRGSDSAVTA
jgi:hypothetical protein